MFQIYRIFEDMHHGITYCFVYNTIPQYYSHCHSPLPDWIVDVDGLGSDEDTAVQRNFQKGILATDSNFHTKVRINCD